MRITAITTIVTFAMFCRIEPSVRVLVGELRGALAKAERASRSR